MKTPTDFVSITSLAEVKLPFLILRACRCSFEVEFPDGTCAFITNHNLLRIMNNEADAYAIIEKVTGDTVCPLVTKWVVIRVSVWTDGVMPRISSTRK